MLYSVHTVNTTLNKNRVNASVSKDMFLKKDLLQNYKTEVRLWFDVNIVRNILNQ
jgi:hypothetical protein